MALSVYISTVTSNNDYTEYTVRIYQDYTIVYQYNRRTIHYDNGVSLPTYTDISDEAYALIEDDSLNECGTIYKNNLNCTISSYSLDLSDSITPENGDVLGSYLNSSNIESFETSFITCAIYGTRQTHNFEYGNIVETKYHTYKYIYSTTDGLVNACTHANDTEHNIFRCDSVVLNYTITSYPPDPPEDTPPDDKIETTCCILVCCEPDKYILIYVKKNANM